MQIPLIFAGLTFVVGAAIMASAVSLAMIIVGRLILGLGVGVGTTVRKTNFLSWPIQSCQVHMIQPVTVSVGRLIPWGLSGCETCGVPMSSLPLPHCIRTKHGVSQLWGSWRLLARSCLPLGFTRTLRVPEAPCGMDAFLLFGRHHSSWCSGQTLSALACSACSRKQGRGALSQASRGEDGRQGGAFMPSCSCKNVSAPQPV